ncbi:hypothetical protein [Phenylobacterium sp.]|uniref:hypothetical protein n=1 Tax=Phenylobacterium sp. TaxID=1871053 RepID=UPI003BA9BF9D
MSPKPIDHRPPLAIAECTWEREVTAGRRRLVGEAARLGYRLVIVGEEGVEWAPADDPAEW